MNQLNKTFGLSGVPETRIEQEFENVYKTKGDAQMVKYQSVPNVSTVPQAQPILVKDANIWYIYIRVDDKFFKTALTAV